LGTGIKKKKKKFGRQVSQGCAGQVLKGKGNLGEGGKCLVSGKPRSYPDASRRWAVTKN